MAKANQNSFENIADKWVEDALTTKLSELPPCLYHYTDANGLIGMLTEGSIWATDYRFLNDKSEIRHTKDLLSELISERLRAGSDELSTKLYGEVLRLQRLESENDIFIFSMSEERDDLSQWRGYARDGLGFTVGFCARSIYETSEPEDAPFGVPRVEYERDRQLDILSRSLDEINAEFHKQAASAGTRVDHLVNRAASWFSWCADSRAASNKHSSFKMEKEWRLVALVPKPDKDNEIKVRSSGLRLVQYIDLKLGEFDGKPLPIKKIGIGPGFRGTEEVHAVRALCRLTGYDPEIYFADTPYRRV